MEIYTIEYGGGALHAFHSISAFGHKNKISGAKLLQNFLRNLFFTVTFSGNKKELHAILLGIQKGRRQALRPLSANDARTRNIGRSTGCSRSYNMVRISATKGYYRLALYFCRGNIVLQLIPFIAGNNRVHTIKAQHRSRYFVMG